MRSIPKRKQFQGFHEIASASSLRKNFQKDSILRRDPRGLVDKSHFPVRFGDQTPTPCFTNHFIFPSNNFKAKCGGLFKLILYYAEILGVWLTNPILVFGLESKPLHLVSQIISYSHQITSKLNLVYL